MPGERKSRVAIAMAAIVTIGVTYLVAAGTSWYNRKPFCNAFSLRHGYLLVPAWTAAPTFVSEPGTGSLLYLDLVDNVLLLVTANAKSNQPVVASPVISDGMLVLRFQDGETVAIGATSDSFVHVHQGRVIDSRGMPAGTAKRLFTTARDDGDAAAFAQLARIVPESSG